MHRLPVHGLHADGTDVEYRCSVGEVVHKPKAYRLWGGLNGTRRPLRHPLNRSGVLDFAAHVSDVRLRTLIVGNSLGVQLHAGLEEAICYPVNFVELTSASERESWSKRTSNCTTMHVDNPDWQWEKEPRIVSTPSGGILGVVKDNTHMMDTKTTWNRENAAVRSLMEALGDAAETHGKRKDDGAMLDVLIYQFQSGHVDLRDFDEYHLEQAVLAASDLFGATTVIFPTIAWMNNVNASRVNDLHDVNDRIRKFVLTYDLQPRRRRGYTVTSVHFVDIAKLSLDYIEVNAKILGIPKDETYTFRLDSLYQALVAQMCASLPFQNEPKGCSPGMVSVSLVTNIFR